MDDFQEQLPSARVQDEDGPVDGLGGQVALERLVDSDPVDIGVVHKPDDLVAEQLPIVLAAQVGLSGLRGVQLQTLADPLTQNIESWVGLQPKVASLKGQRDIMLQVSAWQRIYASLRISSHTIGGPSI